MKKILNIFLFLCIVINISAQDVTYKVSNKNSIKNSKAVNTLVKKLPGQDLGDLDTNAYDYAYVVLDKKDSTLKNYKGDIVVMLRKQKNLFIGLDYIALNEHSLIGAKFGYINDIFFVDGTGGYGKKVRDDYTLSSYTYGVDAGFRVFRKFYIGSGLQHYTIDVSTNNNYQFNVNILAIPVSLLLVDDRFGVMLSLSIPVKEDIGLVEDYSIAKIGVIIKF